ncbi:MAG TPA: diguanylate cyclase [Thermoanaerobaculia bacterium]|nr:diguanylate cyclase [Thermoanaerobaculia bacterium]
MLSYRDKSLWSLSVLLSAEDSAAARRSQELLARAKRTRFEVMPTERLDQAVEKLRCRAYDLMVLDLDLTREPGHEALLRAQTLAHRLPIVVMSAQENEDLALRAVEAGIQDFIIREPWQPEALERIMRHAVVRHRLVAAMRRAHITSTARPLFDAQTGLATEAAFTRRLQETLELSHRFGQRPALLVLELDRFRKVAGRLGPLAASRILEEVGRRLTWCVRRSDLTGRLGEERFAVMLPNTPGSWAVRPVAERLRLAVGAPFDLDATQSRLSGSVGTACFPHDGETAADLLASADAAILEAKNLGGNRCCFFRSLDVPPWPGAEPGDSPAGFPSLLGAASQAVASFKAGGSLAAGERG